MTPVPLSALQQGRLALLTAGLLWSLGGVFIKQLPVGPIAITFYRSLFAALTLLIADRGMRIAGLPAGRSQSAIRNPQSAIEMPPAREMAVSVLLFAALLVTFVAATRATTAANAIILQYTAPVYVIALSALLLREPPRRADVIALGLCMAGVVVLFGGNYRPGAADSLGLLLGLVSGACFGLFTLWQRRLRGADPVRLAELNNAGAALILAGAAPLAPESWGGLGPVAPQTLALLAVMGIVQIALPYALFAWALKRVTGPEASLLTLIEPVLNPVWVALFVGETPSSATVLGGALILTALALRYRIARRR
jgi:drug/metabolite transporter (DMT)-like permease